MAKTSSVFVVTSGYYQQVDGAFTSLDAAKDFVLSSVLLDVLDGEHYLDGAEDVRINEMVGADIVNGFQFSSEGIDFSTSKVLDADKIIETLDIVCVTRW